MCPACGRFLPFDDFSLEHIIPQQAVAQDPAIVRQEVTKNVRSGLTLLCRRPLTVGRVSGKSGCNGWKGKNFDDALRQVVSGSLTRTDDNRVRDRHCIAVMSAAYLALFAQYGYKIVLMDSGPLLRQQFFLPNHCHALMPPRARILLSDQPPAYAPCVDFWSNPFRFEFEIGGFVRAQVRNTTAFVPSAIDPRVPLARTALIKPSRYTLRPNFETAFNAVKVEMSKRAGAYYVFFAPAINKQSRPNSGA